MKKKKRRGIRTEVKDRRRRTLGGKGGEGAGVVLQSIQIIVKICFRKKKHARDK